MIDRFNTFISENELLTPGEALVVAVSGGLDSVVLTHLLVNAGYNCVIAHCNFNLRGSESDGDEAFVRQLAAGYDLPVYVEQFQTEEYAEKSGCSIQMAARELRYTWFETLTAELEIEVIATAHNLNDTVETFFINLMRGTGIKGLTGIPVVNGAIIRPLLFASRREISTYAAEHHLRHREDSSNALVKYRRNKLRHDILPLLEEIEPAFIQTMSGNIRRLDEAYAIYSTRIVRVRNELFLEEGDHIAIPVSGLKKLDPLATWLFELFSAYGFSMEQCSGIERILDAPSGKQFISPTHRLHKDRDRLLLYEQTDRGFERYYIDAPGEAAVMPFQLDMELLEVGSVELENVDPSVAYLDHALLKYPLIVRRWNPGDIFFPLGMNHAKKVSDFFIDNKVPVPEKNRTWLLCSGNQIAWIMGRRIDHRFRISEKTTEVLRLRIYS